MSSPHSYSTTSPRQSQQRDQSNEPQKYPHSSFSHRYPLNTETVAGAYPAPPGVSSGGLMNMTFSPPEETETEDEFMEEEEWMETTTSMSNSSHGIAARKKLPQHDTETRSFQEKMSQKKKKRRSRYLAFLASPRYPSEPMSYPSMSENERKLCLLDLQPFWKYIHVQEKKRMREFQQSVDDSSSMKTSIRAKFVSPDDDKSSFFSSSTPSTSALSQASTKRSIEKNFVRLLLDGQTHYGILFSQQKQDQSEQQSLVTLKSPHNTVATSPNKNSFLSHPPKTPTYPSSPYYQQRQPKTLSLQERLRRERQRITVSPHGITQFSWTLCNPHESFLNEASSTITSCYRIMIPYYGSIFIQDGIFTTSINTHATKLGGQEQEHVQTQNLVPERKGFTETPHTLVHDRLMDQYWKGIDQNHTYSSDKTSLNSQNHTKNLSCWRLVYDKDDTHPMEIFTDHDDVYTVHASGREIRDDKGPKRHYADQVEKDPQKQKKSNLWNDSYDHLNKKGLEENMHHSKSPRRRLRKSKNRRSTVNQDMGAIDPQLSPDGTMIAFVIGNDIYVTSCHDFDGTVSKCRQDHHWDIGDDIVATNDHKTNKMELEEEISRHSSLHRYKNARFSSNTSSDGLAPLLHDRSTHSSSSNLELNDTKKKLTIITDTSCDLFHERIHDSDNQSCGSINRPVRITFGGIVDPNGYGSNNSSDIDDSSTCSDNSSDDVGHLKEFHQQSNGNSSVRYEDGVRINADFVDPSCSDTTAYRQFGVRAIPSKTVAGGKPLSRSKKRRRYGRCISHGLADFVAQEEMERYRGFWWDPRSSGILFTRVDESYIPPYRIVHHGPDDGGKAGASTECAFEEHRYPFAGEENAQVVLGYVSIDRASISRRQSSHILEPSDDQDMMNHDSDEYTRRNQSVWLSARKNWDQVRWFLPPKEAEEYLCRVHWLPDCSVAVQWQNRSQTILLLVRLNIETGDSNILCRETSDTWINLHHMFFVLPYPIDPKRHSVRKYIDNDSGHRTNESFSFLFASERTGFTHVYLYTYVLGNECATLVRALTSGAWVVESIEGVDIDNNVVYLTGTYDSPLEKHLYAVPLLDPDRFVAAKRRGGDGSSIRNSFKQVFNSLNIVGTGSRVTRSSGARTNKNSSPTPIRLTEGHGMHSIMMDCSCRLVIDTTSDLYEPISTKIYWLPSRSPFSFSSSDSRMPWKLKLLSTLHDLSFDGIVVPPNESANNFFGFPSPELVSFPSSDPAHTLYAALYKPDPTVHGDGPYPLILSVYGGPRVQRVNRSWYQCTDLRVQRLCSMGFVVVKCDNRGSARRGLAFEGAVKGRLGEMEVLDQIACVRALSVKGLVDSTRVGIYGWSYGGYLSAMCLFRAPDIFAVAAAGAPVTSWDAYDTHYTERYLGFPAENEKGYQDASLFEHISNSRGKLLIIHGLLDENVHFRHTARLINRMVAAGKPYDLCIFPDERHSLRKLKNRIYLEKKIEDYFLQHLTIPSIHDERTKPKPVGRL